MKTQSIISVVFDISRDERAKRFKILTQDTDGEADGELQYFQTKLFFTTAMRPSLTQHPRA